MNVIRDFPACPAQYKNAVIALGNFDGVHPGHQAILTSCLEIAREKGSPPAVMTFEPHPREFLAGNGEKLRIYPLRRKIGLLREAGIDTLFLARFNRGFSSLSAASFIEDILHRQLAARHIVTGTSFAFGKGREGTTGFMAEMANKFGFGFSACPPVLDGSGQPISSSAIRRLLAAGNVRQAAALLGRPYRIEGRVMHGEQRGRTLGFPTANIGLAPLFKPRFGIYAVRMAAGDDPAWHDAVASLGIRPTFGPAEPLLEVHGFDMNRNLYGQRARVEFVDFIRDERQFDSIDALRGQMAADCVQAKELLAGKS